jgi:hypothetical protein
MPEEERIVAEVGVGEMPIEVLLLSKRAITKGE